MHFHRFAMVKKHVTVLWAAQVCVAQQTGEMCEQKNLI